MLVIAYISKDWREIDYVAKPVGAFWFTQAPPSYFARNEQFWIVPGTLNYEDFNK